MPYPLRNEVVVVTIIDPQDLPSLELVFKKHPYLRYALYEQKFKTIAPVMMLCREALMEVHGLGYTCAKTVTDALAQHGLPHHQLNEHMPEFLVKAFGSVDAAPIGALHIEKFEHELGSNFRLARLKLISLLEEVDPHLAIGNLTTFTVEQLLDLMQNQCASIDLVREMIPEIEAVNHRLLTLGASKIILEDQTRGPIHLVTAGT